MTTTAQSTLEEFAAKVNGAEDLSNTLGGISPCEVLGILFPAIVGDDDVMEALTALIDPLIPTLGMLEVTGAIPQGAGLAMAHDLFHIVQLASGLGHMLGMADALAMAGDLSDTAWDDLPAYAAGETEES